MSGRAPAFFLKKLIGMVTFSGKSSDYVQKNVVSVLKVHNQNKELILPSFVTDAIYYLRGVEIE
jgi:hypothetical protein